MNLDPRPQIDLIVEAGTLLYSVYETQGHLRTSQGEPTGLKYGFLRSVRSWQKITKADNVYICFDLPGGVKKAEDFTEYKSNRQWTSAKADMYSQVDGLRSLIQLTCWTQADAEGHEADDVAGSLARKAEREGRIAYITSTDNDLCSVLSERVRVFMPPKSKTKEKEWFKTPDWVRANLGCWPEAVPVMKALLGDKSDFIAPLPGGDEAFKQLARVLDVARDRDPVEVAVDILPGHIQVAFLQRIRLFRLHDPDNLNLVQGNNDPESLTKEFERMEMKSMVGRVNEFTRTEL
jgi:5'-3' exonuclease